MNFTMDHTLNDGTSPSNMENYYVFDTKDYFKHCKDDCIENNSSSESDINSELEKCAKILNLDSLNNHNEIFTKTSANLQDFLLPDSSTFETKSDYLFIESNSIDMKLDIENKCFYEKEEKLKDASSKPDPNDKVNINLDVKTSLLNMSAEPQLLHLENSFYEDSKLVEKKAVSESNTFEEDILAFEKDLLEIETSSSIYESQILSANYNSQTVIDVDEAELLKDEDCDSASITDDLKRFDCEESVSSHKNANRKECPTKKITPEKYQSSRIFKLAVKSINKEKNNFNSDSIMNRVNRGEFLKEDELKNNKGIEYKIEKGDINNLKNETSSINDQKIKEEVKIIKDDYFEEEKEDLINPKWEVIKNLSTNEERYQQVRKCWGSNIIPDPNKNLSYHSYRKRWLAHIKPRVVTQRKRHASTNLNENKAKRPRSCTYFLDKKIDEIEKLKREEKQEIINKMHSKINSVDDQYYQQTYSRTYRFGETQTRMELHNLRVSVIADTYNKRVDDCEVNFRKRIKTLKEHRNEVLKFYRFYEGLNIYNKDHPTELTETQFHELNEIDNIYKQFDSYYLKGSEE